MLGFDAAESRILKRLGTPRKIQDFLDTIPINFEKNGETCMSPRRVLRERRAHCLEGAIFAAAALRFHGGKPLLLDLETGPEDESHVVALFRRHNAWGALSKTNHAVLRYREPIYKTVRELARSYFHEYFLDNGKKTLRRFSEPMNLARFDRLNWAIAEKDLWEIERSLERVRHFDILTTKSVRELRPADPVEIRAGKLREWYN